MNAFVPCLAFFNSAWGWIVVGFIALLLFGSRLPHVARNLGKGINEFKKGLNEGPEPSDDPAAPSRSRDIEPARKSRIDETSV
jgi:TatA/E family protein of Tat protein translocase